MVQYYAQYWHSFIYFKSFQIPQKTTCVQGNSLWSSVSSSMSLPLCIDWVDHRTMCITCTFSVSNHLQFRFDSQPQRLPVASAAISISVRLEIFAKSKIIWINWAWFWTGACGNGNGDAAEPRQTGVGTAMYKNRKFRKDIYNLAWMEGKKWSGPWRSNLIQ